MATILKCGDCGGTVEGKYENPENEHLLTSWWCPKCQLGREVAHEEDFVITIDMHRTTEIKYLAARLVPRAGLLEIQPLKVCDTSDEASNVIRVHAVEDASYLYTMLNVVKKRVTP